MHIKTHFTDLVDLVELWRQPFDEKAKAKNIFADKRCIGVDRTADSCNQNTYNVIDNLCLFAHSASTCVFFATMATGMSDAALQKIYRAAVVAKLLYAASAWWRFNQYWFRPNHSYIEIVLFRRRGHRTMTKKSSKKRYNIIASCELLWVYLVECLLLRAVYSRRIRVKVSIRFRIRRSVWLVSGYTHAISFPCH